jgi:hypothetical protein
MCVLTGPAAGGMLPIAFTLLAEVMPARRRGFFLVLLRPTGRNVTEKGALFGLSYPHRLSGYPWTLPDCPERLRNV